MERVDVSEPDKLLGKTSPSDMTPENRYRALGCTSSPRHAPSFHVLASPLVQIFSICISTNFDNESACETYGSIHAIEGQDTTFLLYDRDITEPETIRKHGTLSLTGPEDYAILGTTGVTIDLCLKDRIRGIELIKGQYYLDPQTQGIEDSYDKLKRAVIQGEHGFAYLFYTTFQFAITAIVDVEIVDNDDGSSRFADVYGSIVAYYSNNRQYCSSDDELKYLETVLFEMPSDQPVHVKMGTPLQLLRSVVVVPAYSSLMIKTSLSDSHGQFASGLEEFPASYVGPSIKTIPLENGRVQVKVAWENAYRRIYKEVKLKGCTIVADNNKDKEKESKTEETLKKAPALDLDQQHVPSSLNFKWRIPPTRSQTEDEIVVRIWEGYLVEVFSVYIGGINHDVSALGGSIKIYTGSFTPLYDRDLDDPEVLGDDKIARIEQDFAIRNPEFQLVLDLKDPVQNLEVSKGEIPWNCALLGGAFLTSWYNKRICSVIRGAAGYAAVHYTIFNCAIIASVEVVFFCDNCFGETPNLYGSLFARYSGYEYSTDYEKKYYRSRLFNKSREKPAELSTGCRVPLTKSVVAVPTESSLIIEAELKAICDGDVDEEVVYGMEDFLFDPSHTIHREIRGRFCHIEVSVTFKSWIEFRDST